jgi:hypothetical protein
MADIAADTSVVSATGHTASDSSSPPAPTVTVNAKPRHIKTRAGQSASDPDLAAIVNLSRNHKSDQGRYAHKHVVPDLRLPLIFFCTYVSRIFASGEYESSQLLTPPSIVAYLMVLVYARLFLNDINRLDRASFYAQETLGHLDFIRFLNAVSDAPIPMALKPIFDALLPYKDEHAPRLQHVPTLAPTLPLYDIPFLPTPFLMILAHNNLFEKVDDVGYNARFLLSVIFTITSAALGTAAFPVTVANLIGGLYSRVSPPTVATDARYLPSWLSSIVTPLADPATHRQHLRKTAISKIDFQPSTTTSATWNPYTEAFGANTPGNFRSILELIKSMKEYAPKVWSSTFTFESINNDFTTSGSAYIIHGHEAPCHHFQNLSVLTGMLSTRATAATLNPMTRGTFDAFAPLAKFGTAIPFPTGPTPILRTTPPTEYEGSYYLVEAASTTTPSAPGLTVIEPTERAHYAPNVIGFHPTDSNPESLFPALAAGISVYNGNVDGTIHIAPSPADDIGLNNSRYFDGFISAAHIRPRFANLDTHLVIRRAFQRVSTAGIFALWNSTTVTVPKFDATRTETNAGTFLALIFRLIPNAVWTRFSSSIRPGTAPPPATTDAQVNALQVVDLWSSFRYMTNDDARPTNRTVYMAANPGEHWFGNATNRFELPHPSELVHRP